MLGSLLIFSVQTRAIIFGLITTTVRSLLGTLFDFAFHYAVIPAIVIGSLLAMSVGLILGREGPSIHIGGALGAVVAKWLHLPSDRENILVGGGAAAELGVAFDAPIGGFPFAMQEISREFPLTATFAQCVTLTTVAAIIVSHFIAGPGRILPVPVYKLPTPTELGLMLPFAMIVGAYGIILNLALLWTLNVFRALTMRIGWLPRKSSW
jgi:CIC family chloride channel protein